MGQLTRDEMLAKVRARLDEKKGGKFKPDPTEWKPPVVSPNEEKSFKFIILPPLAKGDPVWTDKGPGTGKSITDMGELYYHQAGCHWIDRRKYECPRVHDEGECSVCQLGFDLMSETEDKDTRSRIARTYLARQSQVVNIYFPEFATNPEELRGKVFWFAIGQRAIWDRFSECINRDADQAQGDTPEEAKAYGFFFMSEESYIFNLIVKHKNKYNDYNDSKFLPSTRGPIAVLKSGAPDTAKITTILNSRHDLSAKFPARDPAKMVEVTAKLMSGGSNGGFNDEETPAPAAEAAAPTTPVVTETKASTHASAPAQKAVVAAAADAPADAELQKLLDEISSK